MANFSVAGNWTFTESLSIAGTSAISFNSAAAISIGNSSASSISVANPTCPVTISPSTFSVNSSSTFSVNAAGTITIDTTAGSPAHNIRIGHINCSASIQIGNLNSLIDMVGKSGSSFQAGISSTLALSDTFTTLQGNGILQLLSNADWIGDVNPGQPGNIHLGDTNTTGTITIGNAGAGQMRIQTHGTMNIETVGAAGGLLTIGNGVNATSVNGNFLDLVSSSFINLGVNFTPIVAIGNVGCTTTIDATILKLANFPNSAAGAGAYANGNIGAGKAYLVIDTGTGVISSVTPS